MTVFRVPIAISQGVREVKISFTSDRFLKAGDEIIVRYDFNEYGGQLIIVYDISIDDHVPELTPLGVSVVDGTSVNDKFG